MKTKQILLTGFLGLSFLFTNAQNTLLGFNAGNIITTGDANTYIGGMTGAYTTTGSANTSIGSFAGANNDGNNNTFIGNYAGEENQTGNQNTIVGSFAGFDNSNYSGNVFLGYNSGYFEPSSNKLYIENTDSSIPLIWGDFAENQVKLNGKVGVGYNFGEFPSTSGTSNVTKYNLFVKGGILTEEMRISLSSTWADYVFNKDYKLATLNEVEDYIKQNGHLQNVPSAKEVSENGLEVGEIVKIQQEKIEELTLYLIELNKKLDAQEKKIDALTNNK